MVAVPETANFEETTCAVPVALTFAPSASARSGISLPGVSVPFTVSVPVVFSVLIVPLFQKLPTVTSQRTAFPPS